MMHDAIRNLLAAALLAALAGCASQAPFELPDLDTPASASAQATPQGSYPAYRYGYRPYGPYDPYGAYGAYGYSHYGNSNRPRNQAGTSAPGQAPEQATEQAPVPVPAPVPVVPKQVPPRPRNVERLPQERPARTTKPVDDTRPAPRQLEQ